MKNQEKLKNKTLRKTLFLPPGYVEVTESEIDLSQFLSLKMGVYGYPRSYSSCTYF